MFLEIVENGISNVDKLLICLAIILLLTIVWTILIGIMCKMRGTTTYVKKTNRFVLDDEDDDEDEYTKERITVASTKSTSTKKASKKKTTKTTKASKTTKKPKKTTKKRTTTSSASRTNRVVRSSSNNQEVYVKVKFYRTNKDLIYVAPENVILRKGEKIKVRTDEGNIRTATVTQGNYKREKYKTYEYQTLELVD